MSFFSFARCRRLLRARWALGFAAVAAVLVLAGVEVGYAWAREGGDRRRFPAPGVLVEVRGRPVHVWRHRPGTDASAANVAAARGSRPLVVVVTGLGCPALEWLGVAERLAEREQVLLYDRPGLGWSAPVPGPRSVDVMVEELHDLLALASPSAPVVLVGHSLGGLVVRLYAHRHRHRVAGLALVESSHHDQLERLRGPGRGDPAAQLRRDTRRARWRPVGWGRLAADLRAVCGGGLPAWAVTATGGAVVPAGWVGVLGALRSTRAAHRADVAELGDLERGLRVVAAEAGSLAQLPLLVITAGPRGREGWWSRWVELQRDLAATSPGSRHLQLRDAGHHVHHDEPVAVAAALHELVDQSSPRRSD